MLKLQVKKYFFILLNYAVAVPAASDRATLQQFIKFISFNWKSLTFYNFIFFSSLRAIKFSLYVRVHIIARKKCSHDDDIVSDYCNMHSLMFFFVFNIFSSLCIEKCSFEGRAKVRDENYISMSEINFKFYLLFTPLTILKVFRDFFPILLVTLPDSNLSVYIFSMAVFFNFYLLLLCAWIENNLNWNWESLKIKKLQILYALLGLKLFWFY